MNNELLSQSQKPENETITITQVTQSEAHPDLKEGKRWLVPIDGSKNSKSALYFAVDRMDKKKDTVFLITAVEEESARFEFSFIFSSSQIYLSYLFFEELTCTEQ